MKSLRKQFMAAIAMTLVAAIALGSSTYAWFASNNEVEASGLNLNATTDATFLLISATEDGTYATSASADEKKASLLPVAHESFGAASATSSVADYTKWYYGYSDDVTKSAMVESSKTTVKDATSLPDYVGTYTFWLKADENGADLNNVKIKSVTYSDKTKAVNAIAVAEDAYEEVVYNGTPTGEVLIGKLGKGEAKPVTVYLYFDGNNGEVYSNNLKNLDGSVTIKFQCDDNK